MQTTGGSFKTVTYKKPSGQVTEPNRRQQNEGSENDNHRLALDIILWGFPVKPKCETAVLKFLNIYGVSIEKVNSFHQFENKTNTRTFYHIIITFKDKQSKSELFKARNKLHKPVRWHDLAGAYTRDDNPTIKFGSRIRKGTQFNEKSCEDEHQRVDLDIILSGFPVGTDCDFVALKFLNFYKVSIENVKSFYQFEDKIVITFRDEQSVSELFKAHNNLRRPIRWQDLTDVVHTKDYNPIIEFYSRFNYSVEKQLYLLRNHKIISEYEFRDSFYFYKQAAVSKWKIVSIIEDLNDLVDLLQHVKL